MALIFGSQNLFITLNHKPCGAHTNSVYVTILVDPIQRSIVQIIPRKYNELCLYTQCLRNSIPVPLMICRAHMWRLYIIINGTFHLRLNLFTWRLSN